MFPHLITVNGVYNDAAQPTRFWRWFTQRDLAFMQELLGQFPQGVPVLLSDLGGNSQRPLRFGIVRR